MDNSSTDEQQDRRYKAYVSALTAKFYSLDQDGKNYFLRDLEQVLSGLLRTDYSIPRTSDGRLSSLRLNGELARRIREEQGLTQKALAEKLGTSQNVIGQYEKGTTTPFKSETGEKYLAWLKENGYNGTPV